ncbi:MAG: crosslink repair DNA glycosylase YcaQ family protein [SAR202 cluster bacterium]|nr:crosslink repair DNA glycosylase YcaQ family protein [SAR202 cluster bacterium]MDP6714805.1 crosslink repair DNA glycosylase YcaQ family protein [SAR202 cluster bacterium]
MATEFSRSYNRRPQLSNNTYPLSALRALALHAQGLSDPPSAENNSDRILETIQQIGCVQIDTLQMVRRSHYLVLWSRLGSYDTSQLDLLLSGDSDAVNGRQLFEYWLHAACLIPLTDYRYSLPDMRQRRVSPDRWRRGWYEKSENRELVDQVLSHIRENGPARSADFDRGGPKRGAWWDWKPAKRALEHLYNQGDLMVSDRHNFQRIYDMKERVLPGWVDQEEPSSAEATRHILEISLRSLGVCELGQVCDYTHTKRTVARPILSKLVSDGTFVRVQAELSDSDTREMVVHRDNMNTLIRAADGDLTPNHTTFLSPFDNLFWAEGRDEQFWGFKQVLEAYKPAKIRQWGYFCLPILHNDRLVGRFDPKLDRKTGTLILRKLYIESDDIPLETLAQATAGAMRDFMSFHQATDLVVEHSEPAKFRRMLLSAI